MVMGLRLWTMQEHGIKMVKILKGDIPSGNAETPQKQQQQQPRQQHSGSNTLA